MHELACKLTSECIQFVGTYSTSPGYCVPARFQPQALHSQLSHSTSTAAVHSTSPGYCVPGDAIVRVTPDLHAPISIQ